MRSTTELRWQMGSVMQPTMVALDRAILAPPDLKTVLYKDGRESLAKVLKMATPK